MNDNDGGFKTAEDLIAEGRELIANGEKEFIDFETDPSAMAILLFTSGTTSKSKAVMLCQKNICKNLMSMFSMLYIDKSDVFMSVLPLHHTYECTCGFLGQVYRGTTIAICEGLRYITTNIKEFKEKVEETPTEEIKATELEESVEEPAVEAQVEAPQVEEPVVAEAATEETEA